MKPCLDCKRPTRGSRCPTCTRAKDRARGTSTDRGYDYAHQQERARWAPLVATGIVRCARCPDLIGPDDDWDLGHDDTDRSKYTGPEHVACNRGTSGRYTA